MKQRWFNSLRARLTLISVLVTTLILAISMILFSVRDYQTFQVELNNNITSAASLIGESASASIIFGDVESAENILHSLKSQENIVSAILIGPDKQFFSVYNQVEQSLSNDEGQELKKYLNNSAAEPQQWLKKYWRKFEAYSVFKPIQFDGEVVGGIYIKASTDELYSKIYNNITMAAIIFVIGFIIAIFIAIKFNHSISQPISKLANIMTRVTRNKDYSLRAVKFKSPNEISILVDGFNEMLEQIQVQDKKLKKYHSELEQSVEIKTQKLQETNTKLEHIAYHDVLTDLPNMRLFKELLDTEIARSKRSKEKFAVLFIDLDDFKVINDSLGHNAGDFMLQEVTKRMVDTLRESDFISRQDEENNALPIARLGGDEFTILLPQIKNNEDVAAIINRMLVQIRKPIIIGTSTIQARMSIGVAIYPADGQDATSLLKNADAAMYHAKDSGKNGFQYFNQDIQDAINKRLEIEEELRVALKENELELYYQPKINLKTQQITGAEALMRWNHPVRGFMQPLEFIPIAERSHLICELGFWCLEQACKQLQQWHNQGFDDFAIAVNVSPKEFEAEDLISFIEDLLEKYQVKTGCLELELTEGLMMNDSDKVLEKLTVLQAMGVKFSIDDFGTGYCSFKYLSLFPVETIKIDRSFVSSLDTNISNATITKSIISLAHNMGMNVVAEGVETVIQADYLLEHQCELAQGYLYSKPIPATEFSDLLTKQSQSSSLYDFGQYKQSGA